jgi:hypothetical protein
MRLKSQRPLVDHEKICIHLYPGGSIISSMMDDRGRILSWKTRCFKHKVPQRYIHGRKASQQTLHKKDGLLIEFMLASTDSCQLSPPPPAANQRTFFPCSPSPLVEYYSIPIPFATNCWLCCPFCLCFLILPLLSAALPIRSFSYLLFRRFTMPFLFRLYTRLDCQIALPSDQLFGSGRYAPVYAGGLGARPPSRLSRSILASSSLRRLISHLRFPRLSCGYTVRS